MRPLHSAQLEQGDVTVQTLCSSAAPFPSSAGFFPSTCMLILKANRMKNDILSSSRIIPAQNDLDLWSSCVSFAAGLDYSQIYFSTVAEIHKTNRSINFLLKQHLIPVLLSHVHTYHLRSVTKSIYIYDWFFHTHTFTQNTPLHQASG